MRIITCAVALLLWAAAPAAAQEWDEYRNIPDGFSINFPGTPQVSEITWTSQLNYKLPGRVYSANRGRERYSLTVVDYSPLDQLGPERAKNCPPGNANCRGNAGPVLGPGYAKHDERGAIDYATFKLLQRDAKLNYMSFEWMDMVEGKGLQLVNNADKSRTYAWIGMHARKLYISEGTVPEGAPEPGLFQQSIGWLDKDGNNIRYQNILYSNAYHGLGVYPVPPYRRGDNGGGGAPAAAPAQAPASGQAAAAAPGQARAAGPAPGETYSQSFRGSQRDNVEYQKIAPIKVFDNLYYVGPGFVSVWLIPTSDGLILVDAAQEPYVDFVIDNIRKAGFDPKNIKYILLTHGHLDHFGGAGKIQQLSGARVATLEEDWKLIEEAAKAPANANRPLGIVPKRDMVIKEGDTVTLGNTSLKVYKLPGHTPGSPSFTFTVYDNGTPHKALIFGGPGQRGGVQGGTEFLRSIERLQKEFSDIEVPVHVHSWLTTYPYPGGAIFERMQKTRRPGDPHPLVDNATWRQWLQTAHAGTLKYIEDAKAGKNVR